MKYSIVIRLSNVVQLWWYHCIMEHQHPRDRQFVYSRFRLCRIHRGDRLICLTFLGDSPRIAAGSQSGELKIFDPNCHNYMLVERFPGHQYPLTVVQSNYSSGKKLVLSSSPCDVKLWDATSIPAGPIHLFDGCKAARFNNSGTKFAALSTESTESSPQEGIMLYDVQTRQLVLRLRTPIRGPVYSPVHFSPSDAMLLYNGVLWDTRLPPGSDPIHQFDQLDCGGGGFHPTKDDQVIINSEVWDIRMFEHLRSVPSLDKTVIKFNASGDVIYAILRRDLDQNVTSAFHPDRVAHPLSHAFRTVDAIDYSDIATIPVGRCVLDLATEPTDSFVGLVLMDERMKSSARVYQIGDDQPDIDSDGDDMSNDEDD